MREKLQTVDPAVLLNVVRQDQRDPNFVLLDWTIDMLSDKGGVNPEGLWCFNGHGQGSSGIKPWSVVAKIRNDPGDTVDPRHLSYWKREYLAHESGLLSYVPEHIVRARCYGTSEFADSLWLWMERIYDRVGGPWGLEEYAFAARQLGRFNAVYVTGTPVPDYSWLATGHIDTWTSFFPPDTAWTNPLVQQSFSAQTRLQVMNLWKEKESLIAYLQRLPQVFSHFDYKRSNLFIRRIGESQDEIVAVDWADCGIGPLGGDLTRLVGGSTFFHDWDASLLSELDTLAFTAYIDGLHDMNWAGDPDVVRLAYSTWFALDWACTAPNVVALSSTDDGSAVIRRVCGCEPEEMRANLMLLCDFALERAEEARHLMVRLKLS